MTIQSINHSVYVGKKALKNLREWWKDNANDYSQIIIIADENTSTNCLEKLLEEVPEILYYEVLEVDAGEASKNAEMASELWGALAEFGADRQSLIINLGGGMVCDLGGFVAGTFMRGIDYINVPTSLLAMVDASVGGKTAVNIKKIKNIGGLFYPPKAVFVYPPFLETLPPIQIKCGYAEMLKHGLIADESHFWAALEFPALKTEGFENLLYRSINIKNEKVIQDFKEASLRKTLNFGHTVGHAIEAFLLKKGKDITHGHAIALGMMVETNLSRNYANLDKNDAKTIVSNLASHFDTDILKKKWSEKVVSLMKYDKKNNSGNLRFTLLPSIGTCVTDVEIPLKEVTKVFEKTLFG